MGFKSKLRQLLAERGLKQIELAEKIGVGKSTVSNWLSGDREPNRTQRKKLAEFFGITEAELFGAPPPIEKLPVQKVPVITWVNASKFAEIPDLVYGYAEDYIYAPVKGERLFALRVEGDCMEPEFIDGDIIVVNPDIEPLPNDYVVAIDLDCNRATFKQYKQYNDTIVLHPLNPKYPDIVLKHLDRWKIVGKVVAKIKKY